MRAFPIKLSLRKYPIQVKRQYRSIRNGNYLSTIWKKRQTFYSILLLCTNYPYQGVFESEDQLRRLKVYTSDVNSGWYLRIIVKSSDDNQILSFKVYEYEFHMNRNFIPISPTFNDDILKCCYGFALLSLSVCMIFQNTEFTNVSNRVFSKPTHSILVKLVEDVKYALIKRIK